MGQNPKDVCAKEKGRCFRNALSSRSRGKSRLHPNPVRIQMLSGAIVRYKRYRLYLQPLDLSGAPLGSWLPAFAFRHVRRHASFRSAPPLPSASLRCRPALPPHAELQLACCLRRCQSPVSQVAFRPPAGSGPLRSGHALQNPPFDFVSRPAAERCIRSSHHFVCSSHPPLGNRCEWSVEPRNMIRIPEN